MNVFFSRHTAELGKQLYKCSIITFAAAESTTKKRLELQIPNCIVEAKLFHLSCIREPVSHEVLNRTDEKNLTYINTEHTSKRIPDAVEAKSEVNNVVYDAFL